MGSFLAVSNNSILWSTFAIGENGHFSTFLGSPGGDPRTQTRPPFHCVEGRDVGLLRRAGQKNRPVMYTPDDDAAVAASSSAPKSVEFGPDATSAGKTKKHA